MREMDKDSQQIMNSGMPDQKSDYYQNSLMKFDLFKKFKKSVIEENDDEEEDSDNEGELSRTQ